MGVEWKEGVSKRGGGKVRFAVKEEGYVYRESGREVFCAEREKGEGDKKWIKRHEMGSRWGERKYDG